MISSVTGKRVVRNVLSERLVMEKTMENREYQVHLGENEFGLFKERKKPEGVGSQQAQWEIRSK